MHTPIVTQLGGVCFVAVLCTAIVSWSQPVEPLFSISLRFHGNGFADIDRVKVRVDDPTDTLPGPPADIGTTDFTIDFWMKAFAAENPAPDVECGANNNWRLGHVIVDRDRLNQDRDFGISIAGGRVVFGVGGDGTGDLTICGDAYVLDGSWHLVSIQRRRADGYLWIYVDGILSADGDGPDGDVSYPDDGVPSDQCGGPCTNSDPFLVIGAEKHDLAVGTRSYSGWIAELRLSHELRYTSNFSLPETLFLIDEQTAALYHFVRDPQDSNRVTDYSLATWPFDGPSVGERRYGGDPPGPMWDLEFPPVRSAWPIDVPEEISPQGHGPEIVVLRSSNAEVHFVAFVPKDTEGVARLAIYNVAGRRMADLSGIVSDHHAEFHWNHVSSGITVGRGVYFARLKTPSHTLTRKFVVQDGLRNSALKQ